jgi:flagellar hook-length control protein FliK
MIDMMTLPAAAGTGPGASVSGDAPAAAGDDFMTRLAQVLQDENGKALDVEALRAWLQGESAQGLPTLAELSELLQQNVPEEQWPALAAQVLPEELPTADRIDVAGLLQAMILAGGGGGGGEPGATAQPAALAGLRRFLDAAPVPVTTTVTAPETVTSTLSGPLAPDGAAGRTELPTLAVATPPGRPGFGAAVGERMVWMVQNDVQQARIQLNPQELGPLEIKLTLKGDQASVTVAAHHALTRDALIADVPRLRAMLADQGFTSVDVNVSQQQAESGGSGHTPEGGLARGHGGVETGTEPLTATDEPGGALRVARGLVDHYA